MRNTKHLLNCTKLVIALLLMAGPAQAANQWRAGTGKNTLKGDTYFNDVDTASFAEYTDPLDRMLSGYRQGMTLTYSSASTIVAMAGEIMVSNSGGTIRLMMRNTSNTNVTFSNIDTGSEAAATTYYVYAGTSTASNSTVSFYISTSSTAPSGVTYFKRLGSFYNDASSNISRINNDNIINEVGEKESKTIDVVYQALTDGDISYSATLSSGAQIILYTDSSSSPTTSVQQLTYNSSNSIRQIMFWSVKAGDYYQVAGTSFPAGTSTEAYYFIPKN